jgi:hypothetical protein
VEVFQEALLISNQQKIIAFFSKRYFSKANVLTIKLISFPRKKVNAFYCLQPRSIFFSCEKNFANKNWLWPTLLLPR